MNTGQITGGLLSVFGNAGAGAAAGYNSALTKEEDTEIEKKKQEALNKFRLSLEGLRAQNNMEVQKQQQTYEIGQKGSGYYLNGKELTQLEYNQLKEKEKGKDLNTIPGLLNTNEYQKEKQQQAIGFFNKTHPKTPEKLSLEEKIYQDFIKRGMSPEEAAEKLFAMKRGGRGGDKKGNELENNNDYLKGTMLEFNKDITYEKIFKLDDRARKRAKEEIEKSEIEKGQVPEQQAIQIKKAAQAAVYAKAGHFRREKLKNGTEAYVHRNKKTKKIDSLFTLFGEPIGLITGNKPLPGTPGVTGTSPPQKANEPAEVNNQSQADASLKQAYQPLTIEDLQKMVNPQYKIDNPISAMTGNETYTEVPSLLTRAQEWMGQTQLPDSKTPHTGEGSIEAALRYVNIGKESLQARKNVAEQLQQRYPDLSDEQIADMVLKAGKQSTGVLNTETQKPINNFGLREDGTQKGNGFLGVLKRPDGKVSTELSIGVEFDGKERLIPSLVPTLTEKEIKYLLSGGKPTKAIIQKAVRHARKRMAEGKSPFLELNEEIN